MATCIYVVSAHRSGKAETDSSSELVNQSSKVVSTGFSERPISKDISINPGPPYTSPQAHTHLKYHQKCKIEGRLLKLLSRNRTEAAPYKGGRKALI